MLHIFSIKSLPEPNSMRQPYETTGEGYEVKLDSGLLLKAKEAKLKKKCAIAGLSMQLDFDKYLIVIASY